MDYLVTLEKMHSLFPNVVGANLLQNLVTVVRYWRDINKHNGLVTKRSIPPEDIAHIHPYQN
jgi:hypothetical protein